MGRSLLLLRHPNRLDHHPLHFFSAHQDFEHKGKLHGPEFHEGPSPWRSLPASGMGISTTGWIGMGILGTQFFEPSEEQPLRLDRQQWVRDLEWRARVPDNLDRH